MFTWENTWKEIEDSGVDVAVVPVGSTEQHGTHMPLSTDTVVAEEIAKVIAQELDAYLTPFIPIGQSEMWLEYPGSLSVSEDTMKAIIADVVDSLVKTGFKTIMFISFHGANVVVYRGFPESLQDKYDGIKVFTAGYPFWVRENWARIWAESLEESGLPEMNHADEAETSLLLALRPELVGPNPTDCPLPDNRYPPDKTMRQTYPSGSMGHGSKASKEKGEKLWAAVKKRVLEDVKTQLD
ncbi:MAG: creatininase family protein [Planctomycetota bacterium]|jgi:creatinine amidohydrolase|nr:creatininase family protein [Planctomycetota bacterium]MDP7248894.1 creatininase family protein [Planctomycetota bacterium]